MAKECENLACKKLVSVVIHFCNQIPWLLNAIESVQKQTYSNWELILVNDSFKKPIQDIYTIIERDKRIRLIEQEDISVASARNAGIAAAQGNYIALLNPDDLWEPEKLEKQIAYMEENGYKVTHTCYNLFDENGIFREVDTGPLEGDIVRELILQCILSMSSAVIERSLIAEIYPLFQLNYEYGENECFWITLAAKTKIGVVREPLTLVRSTICQEVNDIETSRIALISILSYVLHSSSLSIFYQEINQLSKKIGQVTEVIEIKQSQAEKEEKKRKEIKEVRDSVEKRFVDAGFYPKVSIVIPVYNGAKYMRDAINSALEQTYGNIEVIVINDGSQDETDTIARSYGNQIRYYKKNNGGVATALNLGIEKMTGEYFSWLSHDDMYLPNKIEDEVRAVMYQNSSETIIAEGYQLVNALGEYIATVNIASLYSPQKLKNPMFILLHGGINGCAMLIHKSHFERVGVFDTNLPTTQDYDLWFRMFRSNPCFCYIDSSNVLSRSHDEQGSKAMLDKHIQDCDKLWISILNQLTVEEKKHISGSEYYFYKDILKFLKTSTGYQGAIQYAESMVYCKALEEYDHTHNEKLLKKVLIEAGYNEKELDFLILLRNKKGTRSRIIFYLEERYDSGGLNRAVLQVANLLAETYDIIVTTSQDFPEERCNTKSDITEVKLPWKPWNNDTGFKLSLFAYCLKSELIIVSYNCVKSALETYEHAKRFGLHTIAWNHEFYMMPYWTPSLQSCLAYRNNSLKQADAVVWLNTVSAQIYSAFNDNGLVIPNANPYAKLKPENKNPTQNLVAVGRFDDPGKGLEDLLRMFAKVLQTLPKTELFVIGSYSLDLPIPSSGELTYRELIKKLFIPDNILHFIGPVSNVVEYYQKGCVHVFPSKCEGFGLVVLEAATMGLPSVVYKGSGMDDIITNGVDGFTVPQGDYQALADSVLWLLKNPKERKKFSQAAQEMTKRYAPEIIRNMWKRLIENVLEKKENGYLSLCGVPYKASNSFVFQPIREYERLVMALLNSKTSVVNTELMGQAPSLENSELYWQNECLRMQQCFSWRITKPLRLVKKGIIVLQEEGLKAFLKRVYHKFLGNHFFNNIISC